MKVLRQLRRILWRTTQVLLVLLIVMGIVSRVERTPLPNGMHLGLRYVWEGSDDIYLWTKDGELVAPYPIHWMCFSDQFVRVTLNGGDSFIYDIESAVLTMSDDPDYFPRWHSSDLSRSTGGCAGYTTYNVGANLIVQNPSRYWKCTLADPCRLD